MKRYVKLSEGKVFSSPVQGLLHKFAPGNYKATVAYFCQGNTKDYMIYAFSRADGALHLERFANAPESGCANVLGLAAGDEVNLKVGLGSGYVVLKTLQGKYQAVSSKSKDPLGPEHETLEALAHSLNEDPAVPEITEILKDGKQLLFKIHTPEEAEPEAQGPDSVPW